MADNISNSVANSVLALMLNGTPFSAYTFTTTVYVQLHTAGPGGSGIANVAINNVLPGIFATEKMLEYLSSEEFAGMTPDEAYCAASTQLHRGTEPCR